MSNLTYLNDATVLWNLKDRYYNQLIYVSIVIQYNFMRILFGWRISSLKYLYVSDEKQKKNMKMCLFWYIVDPFPFFGFFIMYRRWRQCSVPSHLQQLLGLLTLVASHTIMYLCRSKCIPWTNYQTGVQYMNSHD